MHWLKSTRTLTNGSSARTWTDCRVPECRLRLTEAALGYAEKLAASASLLHTVTKALLSNKSGTWRQHAVFEGALVWRKKKVAPAYSLQGPSRHDIQHFKWKEHMHYIQRHWHFEWTLWHWDMAFSTKLALPYSVSTVAPRHSVGYEKEHQFMHCVSVGYEKEH